MIGPDMEHVPRKMAEIRVVWPRIAEMGKGKESKSGTERQL
jgi:hypothetical protein